MILSEAFGPFTVYKSDAANTFLYAHFDNGVSQTEHIVLLGFFCVCYNEVISQFRNAALG